MPLRDPVYKITKTAPADKGNRKIHADVPVFTLPKQNDQRCQDRCAREQDQKYPLSLHHTECRASVLNIRYMKDLRNYRDRFSRHHLRCDCIFHEVIQKDHPYYNQKVYHMKTGGGMPRLL